MERETPVNELAQALVGARSRFEMPVRWGDLDALNHVNNTLYFRYLEESRVDRFRAAGIGVSSERRNIVLARTTCDFLRPILWPATLRIEMEIQRVGRSSLEYQAELHVVDDEAGPCARAQNIIVGTDAGTGKSSPWTPAELQGLARVFVPPKA